MNLTEHQIEIVTEVQENLQFNKKALLSGISGTGKTTSTRDIIDNYRLRHKSVQVTATTHKALEVVDKMTEGIYGVKQSTIHSFLNLIPDRTNFNAPMVINPRANANYADLVVIDEYSMLTADVIKHLHEWMRINPKTHVLFVGDSSQLIMADKDIDLLGLDPVTSYLTTPMRQGKLSDIAIYSKMVSDFILGKGNEPIIPWGDEIIKYTDHAEFIRAWQNSKTKNKAILAFQNKTVNTYNRNIVKYYRHQKNEFEPGNKVVLRSVVFTTLREMIPNRRTVTLSKVTDKIDYLIVECEYGEFRINKTAKWLNEQTQKYAQKLDWASYYKEREKYCQVHHADALTVHSSQGSSYEEVFIDATDIQTAHQHVRRMAYVAISRASEKAHVFVGQDRDYSNFKPIVKLG